MKRSHKLMPLVGLLVIASVVLAACQPATTPTEAPTQAVAPTTGPQPTTPPQPTAEPTQAPEPVVYNMGHPSDAASLDAANITDGESLLITWHIYEGLTAYESGGTAPLPALAESWEVSDDGLEWTFHLRQGVKFHDGTDFNADAVVANFDRWFDPASALRGSGDTRTYDYWAYMFGGFKGEGTSFLDSVEKVDDSTIILHLNKPNASLLNTLAMGNFGFASQTALEAEGNDYGTPSGSAVGTGAYMVKEWVVNDHITLERNPDYWGTPPVTDELVFKVIPDNSQRLLALQSGELDGMNQLNSEDIESASGDPTRVDFDPAFNVGYLGFNQAHDPWDNLNCRLAVAYAIDKQAIVDTLFAGDAEPASQMMPPSLWGYNESIVDRPFDMTQAQAALDQCVADGETIPEKVIFYVPPIARFYFPSPQPLGEFIQASLAELGIVTEIQSPDWRTVYLPDARNGVPDIFLLGWGGDNGDPDNFLCVFFCGGDNSFAEGPPDAELNDLLRAAVAETDQAKRQTMYEQANQIIFDRLPALPLVHRLVPLAYSTNVTGNVPSPVQDVYFTIQVGH